MNSRHNISALDLLKVIAALAVICIHVSADVVGANPAFNSFKWWTGNFADSYCRWCVPVFVMITGALNSTSINYVSPLIYYKQRLMRLMPPLIFWTFIYLLFRAKFEYNFTLAIAVKSIVSGLPYYHLWYLYMLFGLYFAAPFLRIVAFTVDPKSLFFLTSISYGISAITSFLGGTTTTFLPWFLSYISYFLAGHYIWRFPPSCKDYILICIFL